MLHSDDKNPDLFLLVFFFFDYLVMLKYKLHCCTEWTQDINRTKIIVTSATIELVLSTVLVWH